MRTRILIALVTVATLGVLLTWQGHRQRLIDGCQSSGGIWNGAVSRCEKPPRSPILQRDLQRT